MNDFSHLRGVYARKVEPKISDYDWGILGYIWYKLIKGGN